jgi:DNA polymerase-1
MIESAIAYDVETTGLHRFQGHRMFALATCDGDRNSEVWRVDGKDHAAGLLRLREFWGKDQDTPKVMHNAKFDLAFTERAVGFSLQDHRIHDTYIMSRLVQSDHYSHALDDVAYDLSGYSKEQDRAIKPYIRGNRNYDKVPPHLMRAYQIADVERTQLLYQFFYPKIAADPQLLDVYRVELELLWVTMRMEERGICLDVGRTLKLIAELKVKADEVKTRVRGRVGSTFDPGSPQKVAALLYGELGYPVMKKTKGTQKPSTDKDALAQLREFKQHPVLDDIIEYRSWVRGQSTLASYIDFQDERGRVHCNIRTAGAITGREACADPNLQNVEKEGQLRNPFPVPARRCFRPAVGFVNFHVDYAGIELRILVHYSDDARMLDCLNNGDGDVHSLAAEVFYGKRFTECTDKDTRKMLRSAAKNANFAIPYGASAAKVAATLGLKLGEATKRYDIYKATFPGLSGLANTIAGWVRRDGFVRTAFGRTIHVPKHQAYIGTNYTVQGTAADVLKRAQVRLGPWLEKETGGRVQMILPIHDELIVEVPRDMLGECKELFRGIRHEMIRDFMPPLKVPLEVEVDYTTRDWATKTHYPLSA